MSDPRPPISYTFEVPNYPQGFASAPRKARPYWLHILLLLLTIATTLIVGARMEYNFVNGLPEFSIKTVGDLFPVMWVYERPARLAMGIPFSATLLGILLAHEFGHFLLAQKNSIYATLPYFLPAPLFIGTFGALIRIKSPIRSRRALFDIGIAGPIAGFLVAVPVLLWGLALSKPMPANIEPSALEFGYPLIFRLCHHLLAPLMPHSVPLGSLYLHPIGVAAWVGMFATALNLLPGGQLDGGHILYAVTPRVHKWVTRISIVVLVPLGVFFWRGWLLWAVILGFTGMRHPLVPKWPGLNPARRWLALLALLMLVLTFALAPVLHQALIGS
jgi:membrane-associated protease RseP (regulator of RpoE activity)